MADKSKVTRLSWKILIVGLAIVLPLIWLLVRGLAFDPHSMDAPLIGKLAPDFALQRLEDDRIVSLAEFRGKPLVLNFWATWCIPCRTEHPVLVNGARMFAQQTQFVGIVYQDRKQVVEEWLNYFGGQAYPTLIDIDGKAAIAYGVYGVPETYFIDSNGIIRSKHVGPISFDLLTANLERLR